MSQAPAYVRTTSFADDERDNAGGRSTVATADVDAELDAIAASLNANISNQALLQRADGVMRDGAVPVSALGADTLKILTTGTSTPRGAWLTATAYAVKDLVTQSGNTYISALAHTSGVFATDLAAGKWLLFQIGANPNASAMPFSSTPTISSTNVQAAISEVDANWRALTGNLGPIPETQTASAGQKVFTLTTTSYTAGSSNIAIFVDGLYVPQSDYTQTNSTTITFNTAFNGGEQLTFLCGRVVGSSTSAASVTFQALGTGSVTRNVQDKLREIVSLKDKGAVGDGVADDTTAILAFFADITSGKAGWIPPGQYLFTAPLNLPATFSSVLGTGKYSSVFVYGGASTAVDLLTISGASPTSIKGAATIGGFGVRSNTVMTGGRALLIKWAGHITARDLAIGAQYDAQHNLYHGLEYFSTDFQLLEDFEIQVQGEGLRVSGGGAGNAGPQYDLWVDGGKISGCSVGVHIGGGFDNAYFGRGIATFNGTNVLIDNSIQNFKNQEICFSPQFVTDQAQTGDNYRINDTLANLTNYGQITICGPVTGCRAGYGINVLNWPNCFLNVISPYVANNALNGIYIQDASAKLFMSSHTNIVNNGQYGLSAAFPNTFVVAPCAFSGNALGDTNANIVNSFSIGGALAVTKVGSGLQVKEGSNAKQGVATLVAGTIVVTNTSVTATSRIQLTAQDNSTTGALRVSARVAGTSFTITSSNGADAGVVAYEIFEPA